MRDWYGTPGATGVGLDIDAFSTMSNPGHRAVEECHAVFYIHDGDRYHSAGRKNSSRHEGSLVKDQLSRVSYDCIINS